jgi:hypothetical protein
MSTAANEKLIELHLSEKKNTAEEVIAPRVEPFCDRNWISEAFVCNLSFFLQNGRFYIRTVTFGRIGAWL